MSDTEFYNEDYDGSLTLYDFDGKELRSKEIKEVPTDSYAQTVVRIDEYTDFVKFAQGSDVNSFYLIHWKE